MQDNKYIRNPHLSGEDFLWQGSPTSFLLIHGFTATTSEVRLIAEKLHQAGYTVAGPLLPGHGTHPDDLNRTTWRMWLEKVKETYEVLLRQVQVDRVYVVGESMGALLAIELAAQHPEIAGLILSAPAIKVNGLWKARFLAPFKKYQLKSNKEDGLAWKGYKVYPIKAAVQLLKLQKQAKKRLSWITQPTLVLTGRHDHTIAPDSVDIIMNDMPPANIQNLTIELGGHCIFLDQGLEEAYQQIIQFVQKYQ